MTTNTSSSGFEPTSTSPSIIKSNDSTSPVLTLWDNSQTDSPDGEDEDLSVMGVVVFLIKWLWGAVIAILSLIPSWILITIAVILFIRYLLKPCVQFLVETVEKCCCVKMCFVCDYVIQLMDVKQTRSQLSRQMMNMKVGVWINERDSDDVIPYDPLPEEETLMREVNYELANIVNI